MNYREYIRIKPGDYCSVGTIDGIYVFEILTGFCDTPEFHEITVDEFDNFEEWKSDTDFIVREIKNREVICSGYRKPQKF